MTVCDVDVVRLLGSLRAGGWEVADPAAECLSEDGRGGHVQGTTGVTAGVEGDAGAGARRRRCLLIAAERPQDDERHAVAQRASRGSRRG